MKLRLLAIAAIAASSLTVFAGSKQARQITPQPLMTCDLSGADADFLSTAAKTQQVQLLVGQIASARASESELQLLGKALFEDADRERDALAQLAAEKQFPIAAIRSPEVQALLNRLLKLAGTKLDKKLLDTILANEKQRAAAYGAAMASSDEKISAYAVEHYPSVQENLLLVSKLAGVPLPKELPPVAEPPAK